MVCLNFVIHACLEGDTVVFLNRTASTDGRESSDVMVDVFGLGTFGRAGDISNTRQEKLEVFEIK